MRSIQSVPTSADRLGAHITELHSRITAATCHLLDLIREFDEHRYWAEQGFYSCAQWLNFHCGIGKNAAWEKIRVAYAVAQYRRDDDDGSIVTSVRLPPDRGEVVLKALENAIDIIAVTRWLLYFAYLPDAR